MKSDDDYELMPSTELDYLRREVEKLKRNPLGDTQSSITLLDSINKLNTSIAKLNEIFEGASDDMVKAFNEAAMQEQLRKMLEQQEKLARGIVAVAEMVKELEKRTNAPLPAIEVMAPPKAPSVQINTEAIKADMQAAPTVTQSRNPFEIEAGPAYQPILNQPLPRPSGATPPSSTPQASAIPDTDIPPPPPRRF